MHQMFLCFQNSVSSKDLLPAHENLDNTDFSVADKKNMLALIGGLHSVVLNCILDRSQHKYEIDPIYFFKCTLGLIVHNSLKDFSMKEKISSLYFIKI